MTLDSLRPLADRLIAPVIAGVARIGLTPNAVSGLALLAAIAAAGSFYAASVDPLWYLAGAGFVLLNGIFDVLDGGLARELEMASASGDLLDHVIDRYADIAIIAGLAAGIDRYALGFAAVTGVLLTSYLGTQTQAVGLDRTYGGLLGRADRLVLTVVVGVVAAAITDTLFGLTVVGWLLVLFAVVGHLTALQRLYYALRDLD